MKHGSLFSGIGGFDLAAEWMGWENIFHCEINDFCRKVLKYYWPNAISYGDITKTDFTVHRGTIDIITGGFPCQPFSQPGKRRGSKDDRHLWPEMLRAIKEVQPGWIVGENVFGLLNWSNGLVFHEVQTDLEAAGYITFPYVLPACAKDAPHRRDRVWIIAYRNRNGQHRSNGKHEINTSKRGEHAQHDVKQTIFDNTNYIGLQKNEYSKSLLGQKEINKSSRNNAGTNIPSWDKWPTQSPLRSGNDGIPPELLGITVSKHRTESIKGYGNAIVPQVAYEIFKAIEQYENEINKSI